MIRNENRRGESRKLSFRLLNSEIGNDHMDGSNGFVELDVFVSLTRR